MRFQRKEKDFTMNVRLIDYLRKRGREENDHQKLNEFARQSGIDNRTLQAAIKKTYSIGPELQARLFVHTNDERFKPRDDMEQAALNEWKKNPFPKKTVIIRGDRATAESPHPENEKFFPEKVIELLKKYNVSQKGGPSMTVVSNHAKLDRTILYELRNQSSSVTVGIKAKLFLSFADPAFAPLNDNEKKQTEVWREQIPRPLPCVKSVSTEIPPKPAGKKKGEKIVPVRLTPLEQGLVNSTAFVKAVADKVAELLSDAAPKLKTATDPVASETATNDFISDAFIAETLAILTKATERLDSIMLLGNNPRRKIQTELDSRLPQLEDTLRRLFLSVRAISKTATAEAARRIFEQETFFIKQFESAKGGK